MRVLIELWNGPQETDLAAALRPTPWLGDHSGVAETAQAYAEANRQAIGNLAALLVEKNLLTLDEAASACGVETPKPVL